MAAGMGSRYGGLKQTAGIGPEKETLLDYAIYDAAGAGFSRLIFILRKNMASEFREAIGKKFEPHFDTHYAYQDTGKAYKAGKRKKPWGTGHAVLTARPLVSSPFAVINADDYYGKRAFSLLADRLAALDSKDSEYLMAGYQLKNTLALTDGVSRGLCKVDNNGFLERIEELNNVKTLRGGGAEYTDKEGKLRTLAGDEIVSMNLWGFTPAFLKPCIRDLRSS